MTPYLRHVKRRYDTLFEENKHSHPLFGSDNYDNRTVAELTPLATRIGELEGAISDLDDLAGLEIDEGLEDEVQREIDEFQQKKQSLFAEIMDMLVPRQAVDSRDVSLEVTAGVGGQEACLFTGELFEMYERYSTSRGWTFDVQQRDYNDNGGVRKASAIIGGTEAFRRLKFEGGVHRVQRNPKTEKSGRVHTSTSAVAVMPVPNEVDVVIHAKDLRVDTFKSSGSGGQHVNTTDSAVRVVHIPTGTVSECQTTRCQHKNKANAINNIRTRIYEEKLEVQTKKIKQSRKLQFGSGARSDKIRTYNFPQDRVTDHRLQTSAFHVADFLTPGSRHLEDSSGLDAFIQALLHLEHRESIQEKLDDYTSMSSSSVKPKAKAEATQKKTKANKNA